MSHDEHGAAGSDASLDALMSALEAVEAELDELRVANFRLERENLRLRISLGLLLEGETAEDALDSLAALSQAQTESVRLEG